MTHITLIGSRNSGSKNDPELIAQALRAQAAEVTLLFWEDLVFDVASGSVAVTSGKHNIFAVKPDQVIAVGWYKNGKDMIYRDIAYSLSLIMSHMGIPFWNSEMGQQRSTSKLSCLVHLALNNVAITTTRFSLRKELLFFQAEVPYVAKAPAASRGNANHLVTDDKVAKDLLADTNRYLLQPFLPNDHDLRVICVGGKPVLALRRSRYAEAHGHMNNTSQGGSAEWIRLSDVPSQLLQVSEKICTIMKRELAGIDFIPDADSPYGYSCLEVNAVPQLTSGFGVEVKMRAMAGAIMGKETS